MANAKDRRVNVIDILDADDERLRKISRDNLLSLNIDEMHAVKDYYSKKGRNPRDVELETIAQTWSEHCKHKTLTGLIEYKWKEDEEWKTKTIDNLLKSTVMKVTSELNKEWCLSVFKDNAGIIEFDRDNAVAFKVETHNHPSALEPYGGAGTGIGGVIRDILGVGLGAKPIMNTDIFCFGPPDYPYDRLPEGVLHPKRIMKGVVAGVRDYGNRMGIPTANGAVYFDEGYTCNPLVYCGTIGIMPRDKIKKEVRPGDLILAVGGRTGRDGIHGATFSSLSLDKDTEVSAVQIGNPIMEKKVTDTVLQARDRNLYRAITDCGAGGFSSAVGELGEDCGACVHLERAPLKYKGLLPWEIWVSEAQERMVLVVPPEHKEEISQIFARENVEATFIGEFTSDKKLTLYYEDELVGELDMDFLHKGVPRLKREAVWDREPLSEPDIESSNEEIKEDLLKILASPNVSSKEWIIHQYDHEVQAQTVLKPLQGIANDGPGDGCILKPLYNSYNGIVISNGLNPQFGLIDPYWMAASAIDEALRNIICCGGNLQQTALLDNFCWGDPRKQDRLAGIVRAAQACYDIAKGFGVPFISGKDSLNNEYIDIEGVSRPIPPTLLISAISVIGDIRRATSMDLKRSGNLIYIVGDTKDEMGGSHYYMIKGHIGNNVPEVYMSYAREVMERISQANETGLIESCHDPSEGGLGVCLSEMCFSGGKGVEIFLGEVPYQSRNGQKKNDIVLFFSESNSRFVVEVKREDKEGFEALMKGIPIGLIGCVSEGEEFNVYGINSDLILSVNIDVLKENFKKTLRF